MFIKILFLLLIGTIVANGLNLSRNPAREVYKLSEDEQKSASYIWRYGGPYGHYCGIFHTDRMFIEPINDVDRACQLHDTCISASKGYLDCFCNEQLLVRMYDVCPNDPNASYYRDQIIRAMNIGTSMCSSECALSNTYKVSPEHGFNAIPFYGPTKVEVSALENILFGLIDRNHLQKFAEDNLIGHLMDHIGSFKKMTNGSTEVINVPSNEILFVLGEPLKIVSSWFRARIV